jgi:hypothetical protein
MLPDRLACTDPSVAACCAIAKFCTEAMSNTVTRGEGQFRSLTTSGVPLDCWLQAGAGARRMDTPAVEGGGRRNTLVLFGTHEGFSDLEPEEELAPIVQFFRGNDAAAVESVLSNKEGSD